MTSRSRSKGFTLIELLIVVAIIGIIAAIAIPNLLNAIQRGKQKRSMSDLRSIGTSVESYQVDNGRPPNAADGTMTAISAFLEPTFIKKIPVNDAWKGGFAWVHIVDADEYTVYSTGKDRTATGLALGGTTNFNCDLYYSDGQFTIFPDGTQN